VNQRFAYDLERCGAATADGSAAGGTPATLRVAGADEAGRGCLAGPLVSAAVCFDYAGWDEHDFAALGRLTDSKRLSEAVREELYAEVLRRARRVVVVARSSAAIDERGLHVCNLEALAEALEGAGDPACVALVDGFPLRGCELPHEAVVGGDLRPAAVAAASVIAKVTRDRVMRRLHEQYPQYGFDRHVGYATAYHQEMITAHGVCPLHRLSFDAVSFRQLGLGLTE
jgi:ribonuclease HII